MLAHIAWPAIPFSKHWPSGHRPIRLLLLLSPVRLPPLDRDLGACSMDLSMETEGDSEHSRGHAGNTGAARPIESQDSISVAEADIRRAGDLRSGGGDAGFLGEDSLLQVCSEATSGWTRRVRIRKAPAERELNPNRKSALELSMRAFILKRDGNVVNPAVGTSFDSLDEAYQFYNLYSWELGFGIRYSKSRLNVERVKCMQEIVCGCAGEYKINMERQLFARRDVTKTVPHAVVPSCPLRGL
ncbi:uncharacterized protein [Triticum aestivum]|uniref:uncharacterized protein isoform X2 n=1 Tax=Triticum aestivum TaxID=4565 RepID=UPI001D012CCF|nr:uncharacterized protein LOC123134709 isoform X2 [Triticum aestivum]